MTLQLAPDRLSAEASWLLVQWALETGSDEFSLSFLVGASTEAPFCEMAEAALSPFVIEREARPALSRRLNERWVRETNLWRLNPESLTLLRTLLPEGLFTDRQGSSNGWIEDLTIYESPSIRLGVITHEHEATLNLSESEYRQLRDMHVLP